MLLEICVKRLYLLHSVENNSIWPNTTRSPHLDFTVPHGLQVGGGD